MIEAHHIYNYIYISRHQSLRTNSSTLDAQRSFNDRLLSGYVELSTTGYVVEQEWSSFRGRAIHVGPQSCWKLSSSFIELHHQDAHV